MTNTYEGTYIRVWGRVRVGERECTSARVSEDDDNVDMMGNRER